MCFAHLNDSIGYFLVAVGSEMDAIGSHDVLETCGLFFNAVAGREEVWGLRIYMNYNLMVLWYNSHDGLISID